LSYYNLLIFIISIILLSITNLFPLIFSVTFEDYINNEIGLGIKYPSDWGIRIDHVDSLIYFNPPSPNDRTATVVIGKGPLNYPNMTLEDYKNDFLKYITNSSYGYLKIIDINDKGYYLGGYPAIRIEGIMDFGIVKQKIINFAIIKDNNFSIFMAGSEIGNFNTYAPIFQEMLFSFRIMKNQDPIDKELFLNKLLSPISANTSALGKEKANITIVEFADYQCSSCAKFHNEIRDLIISNLYTVERPSLCIRILL
jgi:hypothetical protein